MNPVSASAIVNGNADSIRLSNPRKDQEMGSPINGSRLLYGTIWDSDIGEVRAGIDYHNPSKAIITIYHGDIPSHVVDYDRHHWGFMGVYEMPADWIHKKKGIFGKYDFCERSVLFRASKLFMDWRNMVNRGQTISDIPIAVDGQNTAYYKTEPNPSILIDNLPIEHHKNQGTQKFTYSPDAVFIVERYKDQDNSSEKLECLRMDIQTHGWWQAEDGSWHDTSFSTTKYATREFIDHACANYQKIVERDKTNDEVEESDSPEPIFDESLGRIFT